MKDANIARIGFVLLTIAIVGCGKRVTDPIVLAKIEHFNHLADVLVGDHRRNVIPGLLDDLDLTTIEGMAELDTRIKEYETRLEDWPKWCSDRESAIQKLVHQEFHVGDGISHATVASIVGVFLDNEYLDPQILTMVRIDAETIEIMTGVARGPLDGGGCTYIARLEEGVWRVRRSLLWVS